MKKTVLIISLALVASSAFAQDLTSKKGEPILPEADDWAISMNVDPIFKYVGNAFSGYTGANTFPGVGFIDINQTIIGKMFIDEKSAYRAVLRLGFSSQSTKAMIGDATVKTAPVYPAAPAMVEDAMKVGSTNIAIGVGKEFRRGKTRLQGFYGADAMIFIGTASTKYAYGNALAVGTTPVGVNPNTTNFGTSNITTDSYGNTARVTVLKQGMTFGIGVRGFIGAEYFLFPKISIGAEYGWGIGFQTTGKGTKTVESIGGTTPAPNSITTQSSGGSKFGFDTDINQAAIPVASLKATFHF